MDNETLFYLCGGVLAVSAVVLTFAGLKIKNFPGRVFPLVIVWFAVFVLGATTFAVRYSAEEAEHREHEIHETAEKIEEGSSGPYENEAGMIDEPEVMVWKKNPSARPREAKKRAVAIRPPAQRSSPRTVRVATVRPGLAAPEDPI